MVFSTCTVMPSCSYAVMQLCGFAITLLRLYTVVPLRLYAYYCATKIKVSVPF
jgi:hypothetical protein